MINISNTYAAEKEWYKDYTYTLVQDAEGDGNYIILTKHNKISDKIAVPAKAVIDGVTYKTKLTANNESIWHTSRDKLTSIKFDRGCIVADGGFIFTDLHKLKTVNVEALDMSQATSTAWMFAGCKNLTKLNVTNWDTSNVTNMSGLFVCNFNLRSLDLSSFDMSKVVFGKYDDDMIFRCPSLKNVKTPKNVKKKIVLNSGLTYAKKNGSKLGTKEYTHIPKGKKSITMVCVQGKNKRTSIKSIKSSGGKINVKINPVQSTEWFAPVQYEIQCSSNKNFTDSAGKVANTLDSTYNVQGNVINKTNTSIKGLKKEKLII